MLQAENQKFASASPLSKGNYQTTGYSKCGIRAGLKTFEEFGEIKDNIMSGRPRKL